jgi:hypothetical protein
MAGSHEVWVTDGREKEMTGTPELSEAEKVKVTAFGLDQPEAWEREEAYTREIEATNEPWLIWRRALNVALYPFKDGKPSVIQEFNAESQATRAVYEAGIRSVSS